MELLRIADFSRGLDKITKKFDTRKGFVKDAVNAVFNRNGSFRQRAGYEKYNDKVFTNTKGLLRYADTTGGMTLFTADVDGSPAVPKIYNLAKTSSWNLTASVGTVKRRAVCSYGSAATAGEKMYIFPDYMVFNKTTLADIATYSTVLSATPRDLNYPVFHNNRIFAFNNDSAFWCDDHDGDVWDSGNAGYQVIAKDNKKIMGACSLTENKLIIFKTDAIYMLAGSYPSEYQLITVSNNIGCDSPDSIAVYNNRVYWYYNGAIYSLTSGGRITNLTDNYIIELFDTLDKTKASLFTGVVDNEMYWLFFADRSVSSYNNLAMVVDLDTMAWSYYSNMKVYDALFDHLSDKVYFLSNTILYYFDKDALDDDGSPIYLEVSTGWYPTNRFDRFVDFRDIEVSFSKQVKDQNFYVTVRDEDDIEYNFDFVSRVEGGSTWGSIRTLTWDDIDSFTWGDLKGEVTYDNYDCFPKGAKMQAMFLKFSSVGFEETVNDIILRFWASGRKQRRI